MICDFLSCYLSRCRCSIGVGCLQQRDLGQPMNGIEIYLRHSRGRTLMTFHIPNSLREQFQQAIQGGTVDGRQAPIAIEAPKLEPWAGPERDQDRKSTSLNSSTERPT